jgi:hypothetical protein
MDNYNPNQTVSPEVSSPNNLISAHASPEDFGAQVGAATQRLGQTAEQAGTGQYDVEMIRQGQLNEAAVANAETSGNTQYGAIDGWYKSLRGQAAVDAAPEAVQRVQQVRQNLLQTLPNEAAKRAFNQVFSRSEGFVLRDYGNYQGAQVKVADTEATSALQENTIDQFARNSTLTDPEALEHSMAALQDTTQHLVINSGANLNTKEGQAIYNQEFDKVKDKAFSLAVKTLTEGPGGDPIAAQDWLNQHKDIVPAVTMAKLQQFLEPQVRTVGAKTVAAIGIADYDKKYTDSITTKSELPPVTAKSGEPVWSGQVGRADFPLQLDSIRARFKQQESGGNPKAEQENPYQIQSAALAQFGHPGETVSKDGDKIFDRMMTQYAHDYGNDLGKMATAYYSGPSNVNKDPNSVTPYINDINKDHNGNPIKPVSQYVSDITGGQTKDQIAQQIRQDQGSVYRPKAEYFELHQGELDQHIRDLAQARFPNDIRTQDEAVRQGQQYYNGVIRDYHSKRAANSELVRRFIFGEGQGGSPVTHEDQLTNGPPEVAEAWKDLQVSDSFAANGAKRVIDNNAKAKAPQLTYGTDFYKHFQDAVSRVGTDNPPKFSDYAGYSGPNRDSPLTNTGLGALTKEIQYGQSSPEGAAFLHAEQQYFQKAHTEIVGGPNVHNPNGERIFEGMMRQALPKIQAGRGDGKGAGELFDEDSKDFVGDYRDYDKRTQAQKMQDRAVVVNNRPMNKLLPASANPFDFKSLETVKDGPEGIKQLQQALKDNKITRKQAVDYSHGRGWTVAPSVPVPNAVQ